MNASPPTKHAKAAATLTHLGPNGEAHMVDVGEKLATVRTARAEGFVSMTAETLELLQSGTARKGDVIATARIAGIMAAKRTHELIPLCHPLAITKVSVDLVPQDAPPGVRIESEVRVTGPTGVEMEALTATSVACLTIYDMLKSAQKDMEISAIRLIEKTGGKSGDFHRNKGTRK